MTLLLILFLFLSYRLIRAERMRSIAVSQREISSLYLKIEHALSANPNTDRNCLQNVIQPTLRAYMENPFAISYRNIFNKEKKAFTDSLLNDVHALPEAQRKLAIESIISLGWITVKNHSVFAVVFWSLVATAFSSVVVSKGVRYLLESSSKLFKDSEIQFGVQRIICHS